MSKLYLLEIDNGMEYADYDSKFKLVVAKNISEANQKGKEFMQQNYEVNFKYGWIPSFDASLIDEVEGFKITAEKMEDEN